MSDAISYEVPWSRTDKFDPPEVLASLRAERPLARMVYPDGHVGWIATSYEIVRKVLSDPSFSHSSEIGHFPVTFKGQIAPNSPKIPGMFIHMDPPDHTRYRRMLTREFTARAAARMAPFVETVAAEQADLLRAQGSPADLKAHFAQPLVLRVLSDLIGLPYAEHKRYADAPSLFHDPDATMEEVMAAFGEVGGFVTEVVESKREQPGDDILSRLVADGQLSTEELCNMALLLLFAGYETTESALTVGVFALLHDTDQLAALRADPSRVDTAVEEILRYLTVNQYEIYRTALEDVELNGETIAKGDSVTVSLPAANRDPAQFSCPAALDVDRDPSGHLAFGHGIHQCLGQNLARVELRAGLSALLRAFPDLRLAVEADEVPLRPLGSIFAVKGLPVAW